MPLIACPECEHQVSSRAAACPQCAYPLAEPERPRDVQTIEETGKQWKAIQLISGIAIAIGVIIFIGGTGEPEGAQSGIGILIGFFGSIGYIFGRFGAWWHHE